MRGHVQQYNPDQSSPILNHPSQSSYHHSQNIQYHQVNLANQCKSINKLSVINLILWFPIVKRLTMTMLLLFKVLMMMTNGTITSTILFLLLWHHPCTLSFNNTTTTTTHTTNSGSSRSCIGVFVVGKTWVLRSSKIGGKDEDDDAPRIWTC